MFCNDDYSRFVFVFFFTYPATTESYTYRHTLSLHGALPIYDRSRLHPPRARGDHDRRRRARRAARQDDGLCPASDDLRDEGRKFVSRTWRPVFSPPACGRGRERAYFIASGRRSEEHTSELQSLMRISYAVFCLKKKKT